MDLPVLKQLDVLIGLAVVMLLASTVVTAITQLYLNSFFARARYLRDGLESLVGQVAPSLLSSNAKYIAERLQRHPLMGRKGAPLIGWVLNAMRNKARKMKPGLAAIPIPHVNPSDVVQRHEVVLGLLEWAANEGPLAEQDRELVANHPEHKLRIAMVRQDLRDALQQCGVGDPGAVARAIREYVVQAEDADPSQPSHRWYSQALAKVALSDFTAKILTKYDNTMDRVGEYFSLEAKVTASLASLVLCFAIQLDSLDLIQRLSRDEAFRKTMVAKAEFAQKQYEESQQKLDSLRKAGQQIGSAEAEQELQSKAREADATMRATLAVVRDPKLAVVPNYFAWEEIAQAKLPAPLPPGGAKLKLRVGTTEVEFQTAAGGENGLIDAVHKTDLPVSVYRKGHGLLFVANDSAVGQLEMFEQRGGAWTPITEAAFRSYDRTGMSARSPGILLSWVLLSLGAPFWYDLLKKLLNLRSVLHTKDEAEREARRGEQPAAPPKVEIPGAPPALEGEATAVTAAGTARLRARPAGDAPLVREVPKDTILNVRGFVQGEARQDAAGATVDRWYQTIDGEYVWAGEVSA